METWNGTGTMLYSWRTTPNGDRTATKWLTVMFVPVVPLARYRLRVPTDRSGEGFFAPMRDEYQIIEQGPVNWREAVGTWGGLLRGLAMVAAPWAGFFVALSYSARQHDQGRPTSPFISGSILLLLVLAAWATIGLPLKAIRRARG